LSKGKDQKKESKKAKSEKPKGSGSAYQMSKGSSITANPFASKKK
jgi:hypothetical protein